MLTDAFGHDVIIYGIIFINIYTKYFLSLAGVLITPTQSMPFPFLVTFVTFK